MKFFHRRPFFMFLLGAALLSGCCLVDEDMSDCGGEQRIDYRLRLVTNWQTELATVLPAETDIPVKQALQTYLQGIFTDMAHDDVSLSFYEQDGPRTEHLDAIVDKDRFDFTYHLPALTLTHTAVANVAACEGVILEGDAVLTSAKLAQHAEEDIAPAHRTGLFAGRTTLQVPANADMRYGMDLTMVNAATALVVETADVAGIDGIRAYATGFADGFNLADSTWTFTTSPYIRTDDLAVGTGTQRCFASVHFPSRDYRPTRVVEETVEPFLSENAPDKLWEWHVYASLSDGTVTESVLALSQPLRAGQLKILKAKVHDNGVVSVDDPAVGVSVTLDWNQGMGHIIEL